ncbi:hypothetical protein QF037_000691 [Streptomyces canus]|nr:hypothetical protein [Streptomyces canus]
MRLVGRRPGRRPASPARRPLYSEDKEMTIDTNPTAQLLDGDRPAVFAVWGASPAAIAYTALGERAACFGICLAPEEAR